MLLYIVRHGETDWNKERRLQGREDVPLNEKGRLLAEKTAEALRNVDFNLAFMSPLSRTEETARIILGNKDVLFLKDRRLLEIDWGAWDGISANSSNYVPIFGEMVKFYKDPFSFQGAPGGESILDVCARTKDFLSELVTTREYQDQTILISTHGCAMRALLNSLYEDTYDFWQEGVPANCEVAIVRAEHGQLRFLDRGRIYYDEKWKEDFYRLDETNQKTGLPR